MSQPVESALTINETTVLSALRANVEAEAHEMGDHFCTVYLDNALADLKMTPRTFAGTLSALARKGLYVDAGDQCFGYVVMPADFDSSRL